MSSRVDPMTRAALEQEIRARLGLTFSSGRADALDSGVERARKALGGIGAGMLVERVRRADPAALDVLANELTIGETYFFRDRLHFALVEDVVRTRLDEGRSVRLWSAGCASGEEAYSLAITALESAVETDADDRIDVIGTDVAPRAIAAAHRACYRPWSFRGVDEDVRKRWFDRDAGKLRPNRRVRERVRFELLNLVDEAAAVPDHVDVLFCRNVLLYFDAESLAAATRAFTRALGPDGWLVLGPSDPLLACADLAVDRRYDFVAYTRRALEKRTSPPPPANPREVHSRSAKTRPPARVRSTHSPAPLARTRPAIDLRRARKFADAGDIECALALLTEAADDDAEALLLRAVVRQAKGDDAGALRDAIAASSAAPDSAVAWITVAAAHAKRGDRASAMHAARRARALVDELPLERDVGSGTTVADVLSAVRAIESPLLNARIARRHGR